MTLFKFIKKPIDVQLFTDNEAVFKFCRPQRAAHFAPDWWKRMPKRHFSDGGEQRAHNTFSTMRTCAGLADLYAKGFIQPLWSDFRVDIMPNGDYGYQFADGVSSAQAHTPGQMVGNPISQTHTHLKLESPWFAKEVSGTKLLLLPPVWDGFGAEDICVPPGVISFKRHMGMHVNIFFKRFSETKTYELSFKQPIAHFIPLSDRPVKLRYELVSSEERARLIAKNGLGFFFENRLKKAAKLCPYA
jgi:hypothetical protein